MVQLCEGPGFFYFFSFVINRVGSNWKTWQKLKSKISLEKRSINQGEGQGLNEPFQLLVDT